MPWSAAGALSRTTGSVSFCDSSEGQRIDGKAMTDDTPRYLYPEQIVSTEWLVAHLNDLGLRIFDCTTYLI
jgi:hypothetical protein